MPLLHRLKGLLPGQSNATPGQTATHSGAVDSAVDYEALYQEYRDYGLQDLADGLVAEAIKALSRAALLRPNVAEAHGNLGQALQAAGKIEAARAAYQRAVKWDRGEVGKQARAVLEALPPPPKLRDDFRIGQTLVCGTTGNRYAVRRVMHGGFGAVYIVDDLEEGTKYALKTFQASYLWNDDARERFEREAVTWAMLERHPHIVSALWMERVEGFPCLVLEYMPGGDLAHHLRENGPLPLARALELGMQFCDGMAYAYDKLKIVHRDIKPANCLLAADGALKITDFGLARAFGDARIEMLGLADSGVEVQSCFTSPIGTTEYMAPEQFRPDARLDTRTDIYAFGIMLFEMLTGARPRSGGVARLFIDMAAKECFHGPKALLNLILRCVEPEPDKRPGPFVEVRRELAAIYRRETKREAPAQAAVCAMGASDWQNKGVALQALGLHEQAIACYDHGVRIVPTDADLLRNKGVALYSLGRHGDAIACFDQGLKFSPNDGGIWNNRGLALVGLARYPDALDCYDQGLKHAPRDTALLTNKGEALHEIGRIAEAAATYDLGLAADPRDTVLWERKGQALIDLDDYEAARESFEKGLAIAPRQPGLWKGRGAALYLLERPVEAMECYVRGLEIAPGDSEFHKNIATAHLDAGRASEALDWAERGLALNAGDPYLWLNRGLALHALGRYREALEAFARGLKISPDERGLLAAKARALEESGQK